MGIERYFRFNLIKMDELINKIASEYTWAHDTIDVNKNTFSRNDIDCSNMVRIPIGPEISNAVKFGAKWAVKEVVEKTIKWIRDNNGLYFRPWLDDSGDYYRGELEDKFYEELQKVIGE